MLLLENHRNFPTAAHCHPRGHALSIRNPPSLCLFRLLTVTPTREGCPKGQRRTPHTHRSQGQLLALLMPLARTTASYFSTHQNSQPQKTDLLIKTDLTISIFQEEGKHFSTVCVRTSETFIFINTCKTAALHPCNIIPSPSFFWKNWNTQHTLSFNVRNSK